MIDPLSSSLVLYNEAMDELNKLVSSLITNQLEKEKILRKIEVKAREIKKTDLAQGFSVLGSIAGVRNNVKDMHRLYKTALQYSKDSFLFINYATSLARCDLFDDAFAYAKVSHDLDPTDLVAIELLIKLSSDIKDTKSFLRYASAWEKLTGKPHELYEQYLVYIKEFNEIDKLCMTTSEASLAEIWNSAEEDEAWAHLQ